MIEFSSELFFLFLVVVAFVHAILSFLSERERSKRVSSYRNKKP